MATQFTLVMAQLNLVVGDIAGNTDQVIAAARRAVAEHGAAIVVFPELTLLGYPPEDLLLRPSLKTRISKALDRLLAARLDCLLVVGLPRWPDEARFNSPATTHDDALPNSPLAARAGKLPNSLAITQAGKLPNSPLAARAGKLPNSPTITQADQPFNSLVVIHAGKILLSCDKQLLPNYQVFDERRYFTAGTGSGVLTWSCGSIGAARSAAAAAATVIPATTHRAAAAPVASGATAATATAAAPAASGATATTATTATATGPAVNGAATPPQSASPSRSAKTSGSPARPDGPRKRGPSC